MNVNRTEWTVVPPPGYRVVSQETAMQAVNLTQPTLGTPSILADSEECKAAAQNISMVGVRQAVYRRAAAPQPVLEAVDRFETEDRTRTEEGHAVGGKDLPDQVTSGYRADPGKSRAGEGGEARAGHRPV